MPAPKGHPPYPGCETGGRPLEWTPERIEALRLKFEEWMAVEENFWFKDFISENDLQDFILSKLAKMNEKFYITYKKAIRKQESKLLNGGLFGRTNSTMSIFALKCNHKWIEGTDTSGLEENQSASSKSLDNITGVAIDHANSVKQAGDQPS
jgi:hypothetical protein